MRKWYLGVVCSECGRPLCIAPDPSEGKGPLPVERTASVHVECYLCEHAADYQRSQIMRLWIEVKSERDAS
jgi:hypothetical protein